jgi:hypothetical protein
VCVNEKSPTGMTPVRLEVRGLNDLFQNRLLPPLNTGDFTPNILRKANLNIKIK